MKPPIFFKGKKLKAKDIIGIEDYLLARHNLVSADYGVISMTNPKYDDEGYFYIESLLGIATDGSPIVIEKSDYLTFDKASSNTSVSTADFYVVNNRPDLDLLRDKNMHEEPEDNPQYARYQIISIKVDAPEQEIEMKKKSNAIYCGRYQYGGRQGLTRIQPPYFYSLQAAITFMGKDKWIEWTEPIRNALRKLLEVTGNTNMISYKLAELVFNYHRWPLKVLFQNCIEITWLSRQKDNQAMLSEQAMIEMLDNQLTFSTFSYRPYDLPHYINKLLDLSFPLSGWNLLYKKDDYNILPDNHVRFEKRFEGKYEFKIIYPNQIGNAYLKLNNNGTKKDLIASASSEDGFNSRKVWCHIFIYKLKPALEKGWYIELPAHAQPESIYYRILKNNDNDTDAGK